MPRVLLVIAVGLLLLVLNSFALPQAVAASLDAAVIKAGLRTTQVEEGDFIERVVAMSKEGDLPPQLVETTFQWARKKPEHRFQYFKRAMITRAAKLGITLH